MYSQNLSFPFGKDLGLYVIPPLVVKYRVCIYTNLNLIGISSYLLINFWTTRIQANKSGIKALTVNRVGDMGLSLGFFAMLWVFGNVDYASVFALSPYINETAITVIGLLFLVGAMAKSAQLGLHTWLPDKYFFSSVQTPFCYY
jgi:NADH:ubiquinone oxidoreductase subunit 5 (subunit L)/multisubunit Na+/H+ antiporter MnhA subunit